MRTDILERKSDIIQWIDLNQSKAFMCKQLKCKPETLNGWLNKMGIDYVGNQSGKGIKSDPKKLTALEYLNSDSYISTHRLRLKLLEDGIKEAVCEGCGLDEWNNLPIPLELHHIDSNRHNNDLGNLKILCPNCHAQQ